MGVSRVARLSAAMTVGFLGLGAVAGASASPIFEDPNASPLERQADLILKDPARPTTTIVSLEVPWEPGDTVGASAEAPAPEPEVAESSLTEMTASRSVGVGRCGVDDTWTGQVRSMITDLFGISNIGGYRPGDSGDHGSGLALDVMVPGNAGLGDSVAQWALDNMGSLNVAYVIWQQQINMGGGWSGMEDRGSITANHYDHVHISLNPGWGTCG